MAEPDAEAEPEDDPETRAGLETVEPLEAEGEGATAALPESAEPEEAESWCAAEVEATGAELEASAIGVSSGDVEDAPDSDSDSEDAVAAGVETHDEPMMSDEVDAELVLEVECGGKVTSSEGGGGSVTPGRALMAEARGGPKRATERSMLIAIAMRLAVIWGEKAGAPSYTRSPGMWCPHHGH